MANELTKIPKFRRCVLQNFPFIEQDFDALTDYQLLCKVVEYLNKVISSQNEVIEITESLTLAFNELQSFVEHYFDNLDVQEEINNKLDQMVEAGTLQEIIGEYLNATTVWGFDTVADMKASTNLIDGSFAKTLGRDTLNDGGGATYKIRNITNEDVVDDTHIISIGSGTLIAELINPFVINPDTFAGDSDTAKLQNAIDYATEKYNDGYPVIITLNRLYDVADSLDIETDVTRGQFTFASDNGGGFILNSNVLLFTTSKSYVSDLTFDKITFKGTEENGSVIMNSPKFINIKFLNCTFKTVDKCVYSDTYLQAYTFDNCLITGGKDHFIEFAGAYYLNVNNCTVEHRKSSYFIKQNHSTTTVYNKMFDVIITNSLVEGFVGTGSGFIYITQYDNVTIENNYFESLINVITHDGKNIAGVLNIKNNRLHQPTSLETRTTSGMLVMKPYTTNVVRMGQINFEGNEINNTYAIYFDDMTQINFVSGQSPYNTLHYRGNYVNSDISSTYYTDGRQTCAPFNLLPIFSNPSTGDSKYYRCFWDIANKITWTENISANDTTYALKYVFQNARLIAYQTISASLTTSPSYTKFYIGFDVYQDDLFVVSSQSAKTSINFFFREGTEHNKYLAVNANAVDDAGTKTLYACIELCGNRG